MKYLFTDIQKRILDSIPSDMGAFECFAVLELVLLEGFRAYSKSSGKPLSEIIALHHKHMKELMKGKVDKL